MEIVLPASALGMPPRHAPDVLEGVSADPSVLYSATTFTLPGRCIDGRPASHGTPAYSPALPGGFLSILLGWALAHRDKPLWAAHELEVLLRGESQPCATHTGIALDRDGCGCGAIDFLPSILHLATQSGGLAEQLGLGKVTGNVARELLPSCPTPGQMRSFVSTETEVVDLAGDHNEIGILINRVPGTTLDPSTLRQLYGDVQFFHVDTWAFETTAHWVADHCDVRPADVIDLLASFTAATLATLCGPGFPVIHHDEKSSK